MSKIIKSVNFQSGEAVSIDTSEVRPDLSALLTSKEIAEIGLGASVPVQDAGALEEAQSHIRMMLDQANMKIDAWREEAHKVGWQAGHTEARQAVENELHQDLERARQLADSAIDAHKEFLRQNQIEIGRLAVAIARKILGKELILDPNTVTDIVTQVIEAAGVREACYIRVHPADYETLQPHWETITKHQQSGRKWDLMADKHVERGGCTIDVAGGTIDGQLSTQLTQIEKALEQIGG